MTEIPKQYKGKDSVEKKEGRKRTTLLLVMVVLLSSFSMFIFISEPETFSGDVGEEFIFEGIGYEVTGTDTVGVTYNSYEGDIEIPSSVIYSGKSYTVTSITNWAFFVDAGLTSVKIPSTVTDIEQGAFYDCTSLNSISVHQDNNDYSSEDGVLFNKNKTELIQYPPANVRDSYIIPSSVMSIADWALNDCINLQEIIVGEGNEYYSSVDGVLFNYGKTELIQYPIGNTNDDYTVPQNVLSIGKAAFYDCTNLTTIDLNSVETIGDLAFYGCTSMVTVIMPLVKSIGEDAFNGCLHLTSIDLDSVLSIGPGAFTECNDLLSVDLTSVASIGNGAFYGCIGLTSIHIPKGTSIGDGVFIRCTSLLYITVEDGNPGLSSVNGVLFNAEKTVLIQYPPGDRTNSYVIPDSVTQISFGAFAECIHLTSITIPSSVTTIGDSVFSGCIGLTSIDLNSITSLEDFTFYGCVNLSYIDFGSVTHISKWVFFGCTALTSITIPSSVRSIDHGAFHGSAVKVAVLSHSTTIEYHAFQEDTILLWTNNDDVLISAVVNDDGDIEMTTDAGTGKAVRYVTVKYGTDEMDVKGITNKWIFTPASGGTEFEVYLDVTNDGSLTTSDVILAVCLAVAVVLLISLFVIRRN